MNTSSQMSLLQNYSPILSIVPICGRVYSLWYASNNIYKTDLPKIILGFAIETFINSVLCQSRALRSDMRVLPFLLFGFQTINNTIFSCNFPNDINIIGSNFVCSVAPIVMRTINNIGNENTKLMPLFITGLGLSIASTILGKLMAERKSNIER